MDGPIPNSRSFEKELRLARPPRALRTTDFVSTLQVMQAVIGAQNFSVLRLAGYGLPSTRKLRCVLSNWGADAEANTRAILDGHGATLMEHLESSLLPVVWEGAGENTVARADVAPFARRLAARQLSFSGVAFPVRFGTSGNGYVVFSGNFIELCSDICIDMHMKSCQVMVDMMAAEEKKALPAEALSDREIACLQMAGDGCISEVIAEKMGLSVHTVNAYLGTATTKLDAVNRIQAIAKAIRLGYIN